MGNFNRDRNSSGGGFGRKFGGGKSFGDKKKFGGRDTGRPPMYDAVCSECGADCQVPFRPTGERPIFCSSCFERQGNAGARAISYSGDRRERPRFEDRKMYDAVCDICGRDCQVPFKPTSGKPVLCSDCFKKPNAGSGRESNSNKEVLEQLASLNNKLDKLFQVLAPRVTVVTEDKKEEKKKIKKVVEKVAPKKEKKVTKKKPVAKKKK